MARDSSASARLHRCPLHGEATVYSSIGLYGTAPTGNRVEIRTVGLIRTTADLTWVLPQDLRSLVLAVFLLEDLVEFLGNGLQGLLDRLLAENRRLEVRTANNLALLPESVGILV